MLVKIENGEATLAISLVVSYKLNYHTTEQLYIWAFIPKKLTLMVTQNLYTNIHSRCIYRSFKR